MPTYLTPAETAKNIRDQIKRELGATSRQVSVKAESYSMGSTIHVTVKDVNVSLAAVRRIALAHERVQRCRQTGEIMSGGNRFIDVEYSTEALRPLRDVFEAALRSVESTPGAYASALGMSASVSSDGYWTATGGIYCHGLEFCARQMAENYAQRETEPGEAVNDNEAA